MTNSTGVCFPKGFKAKGVSAGIKPSGKKDVSVLFSDVPSVAAGVFTRNIAKASPVLVSEEHLAMSPSAQAIVFSSGNANAANGPAGDVVSLAMCKEAAQLLKLELSEVLIAQTGLIGIPLDQKSACSGVREAIEGLSYESGDSAAEAMMTTDSFPKTAQANFEVKGAEVRVGGMAKGAAMLAPSMATMLGVVTTDAKISATLAKKVLQTAMEDSFHVMVVDDCMSTNDTVFLLANGMSDASEILDGSEELDAFQDAVNKVCQSLAQQMAQDGEGSSKFLTVKVSGASSKEDARAAARKVAASLLVKCSLAGEVQYWGRVIAELGASGAVFDPREVDIFYGDFQVTHKGIAFSHDEVGVSNYMKNKELEISADLKAGVCSAEAYGCDMTLGYLEENMGKS